jgi:hypothetical protein
MSPTRREFVTGSSIAAAAALVGGGVSALPAVAANPPAAEPKYKNRIGCSTYSFWHFDKEKTPIELLRRGLVQPRPR